MTDAQEPRYNSQGTPTARHPLKIEVVISDPELLRKLGGLAIENRKSVSYVVEAILAEQRDNLPEPKVGVSVDTPAPVLSPAAIREQAVLELLIGRPEGLSVMDLSVLLGCSQATAYNTCRRLLAMGQVAAREVPTGGKPAHRYSLPKPSP